MKKSLVFFKNKVDFFIILIYDSFALICVALIIKVECDTS